MRPDGESSEPSRGLRRRGPRAARFGRAPSASSALLRGERVEGEVQRQYRHGRLTEDAELAIVGVGGDELAHRRLGDAPDARDAHIAGWRYQLAVFANLAAAEAHVAAPQAVDRYFALWSEPDADRRLAELRALASPGLTFRDRFGVTASVDDLVAHIGAAQQHMPGLRIERAGEFQQCQGTGVADWVVRTPDGTIASRGRNVFDFTADGRLARVVGLWA